MPGSGLGTARTVDGSFNDLDDPEMGSRQPLRPQRPARGPVPEPAGCSSRTPASSAELLTREEFRRPRSSTCWPPPGSSSRCTTGSATADEHGPMVVPLEDDDLARAPDAGPAHAARTRAPDPDTADLRHERHPLVGRLADLRSRPAPQAMRARAPTASCSLDDRGLPARPRGALDSPGSPTTGGSASRCCTRCSCSSTTRSATSSRGTTRAGRRRAVRHGAAGQRRPDGEDPHRRVDAGDPRAPATARHGATGGGSRARRLDSASAASRTNEEISGIPGSPTDHHGAPYSLTEEFVAVYRLHPLLPDDFRFRSLADDAVLQERTFAELGMLHGASG